MLYFRSLIPLLAAALLLLGAASAQAEDASGKPTVVKIHASWCGTCAKLEGTWTHLKETYGDTANFVVFDVTDRAALQKSKAAAEELGLATLLEQYKSSTGTIAIVDSNGETLNVFKGVADPTQYDEVLGRACTS